MSYLGRIESRSGGGTGGSRHATDSSGVWTVQGSGADIWGTADSFQFVHQTMTDNGRVEARVSDLQNTNPLAKVGVMVRRDLTTGPENAVAATSRSDSLHPSRPLITNPHLNSERPPFGLKKLVSAATKRIESQFERLRALSLFVNLLDVSTQCAARRQRSPGVRGKSFSSQEGRLTLAPATASITGF